MGLVVPGKTTLCWLVYNQKPNCETLQPETKGATLEEMDRVFKSRTGVADAEMLEQARRDVGIVPELEVEAILVAANETKDTEKT